MVGYLKVKNEHSNIYYKHTQEETFNIINDNLAHIKAILCNSYNLIVPKDLNIVILNNWHSFLSITTPLILMPFLGVHYLLVNRKMRVLWPYLGSWYRESNNKFYIGIKNINLIKTKHKKQYDKTQKSEIFVVNNEYSEAILHLLIHDIVQVCLHNHNAPQWLIEGICLNVFEDILRKQKIKDTTLNLLASYKHDDLNINSSSTYVIGYWFVKYLSHTQLTKFKNLLLLNNYCPKEILNSLSFEGFRAKVIEHFCNDKLCNITV